MKMRDAPLSAKIAFWTTEKIGLRDKVQSGIITMRDKSLQITNGTNKSEIQFSDIRKVDLRKWAGIGTYIHIKTKEQIINFFIPRINIANLFIINNYFRTKKFFTTLTIKIPSKAK